MNISEVKERLLLGENLAVEVMRNPADVSEWLLWIRGATGKSFMLCGDDNMPIRSVDTTPFFHLLKDVGFKQATVLF